MRTTGLLLAAVVAFVGMLAGCDEARKITPSSAKETPKASAKEAPKVALVAAANPFKPKLLVSCGQAGNTPDGVRLAKWGDMIVACPNFNTYDPNAKPRNKFVGKLMKITKDNKWESFSDFPAHPDTGVACPMGMDFGPDGNLYVADNQYFYDKAHKSRLIRVVVKNGKAVKTEVVVEGFKLANAVMFKGNDVYVSDTFFDVPDKALSGIYRISLAEMNAGKPVVLLPKDKFKDDPHCIATWETQYKDPAVAHRKGEKAGADGLTFDADGNLYSGNFGDGVMFKVTFKADGKVDKVAQFVKAWPVMSCVDGIFYDKSRNCIFVADSEKNAIQVVWLPDGKVTTLWENGDTDGADGLLDQPCEPALRGNNELIVVNFDMPFPGLKNTKFDAPYTISTIDIGKLQRPK